MLLSARVGVGQCSPIPQVSTPLVNNSVNYSLEYSCILPVFRASSVEREVRNYGSRGRPPPTEPEVKQVLSYVGSFLSGSLYIKILIYKRACKKYSIERPQ